MRTAAVLPVKSFVRAKQRLGASVEDQLRLRLAEAMVTDVLEALAATDAIAATFVVTREQRAALAARAHGAIVLEDGEETGQSQAATLGIGHAAAAGYERVLCVPGDCPALDPAELTTLLAGSAHPQVTVLPDRHGSGTNGLLLSPPTAISPSFGPDSRARHERLAAEAGVPCRVEPLLSLSLDVDTGEDLAVLRDALSRVTRGAVHTRAVLAPDAPEPAATAQVADRSR